MPSGLRACVCPSVLVCLCARPLWLEGERGREWIRYCSALLAPASLMPLWSLILEGSLCSAFKRSPSEGSALETTAVRSVHSLYYSLSAHLPGHNCWFPFNPGPLYSFKGLWQTFSLACEEKMAYCSGCDILTCFSFFFSFSFFCREWVS